MNYEKVWRKVLNKDEEIKYEFSIANRYRKFVLIMWAIISIPLLFAFGLGLITFAIALFAWYYMKVAHAYAFTNKRVLVHTGWLSTQTISIDYDKITDVTVKENVIDRAVTKSGMLSINTAGTANQEVMLRNIDSPYEVKKRLDVLRG